MLFSPSLLPYLRYLIILIRVSHGGFLGVLPKVAKRARVTLTQPHTHTHTPVLHNLTLPTLLITLNKKSKKFLELRDTTKKQCVHTYSPHNKELGIIHAGTFRYRVMHTPPKTLK